LLCCWLDPQNWLTRVILIFKITIPLLCTKRSKHTSKLFSVAIDNATLNTTLNKCDTKCDTKLGAVLVSVAFEKRH
jgi:hypothetical protein